MGEVLGIDIGGTAVKVGLFSKAGSLEATTAVSTDVVEGEGGFRVLVASLEEFLEKNETHTTDIVGVGIDVPGPVDEAGQVIMLPNAEIDVRALKDVLSQSLSRARFSLANDANAAALGEFWQGAAKGARSFVLIALGTGVGAGVVENGTLVSGAFGAGGEIGHLTVNRNEPSSCGCGRRGCLEQYASASGIVSSYIRECAKRDIEPVRLSGPTDTISVFNVCRSGDEAAKSAISLMCDSLGFALAQVSAILDPELYLIGGGVSGGFELYADELRSAFVEYCLPACSGASIMPASLGNEAALYGNAFLVLSK